MYRNARWEVMSQKGEEFDAVSSEDSAGRGSSAAPERIEKTADAIQLIDAAFEAKGLFSHLLRQQRLALYEIMKPVTLAPGTEIMRQGDDGDTYIVIEKGEADVYVAAPGQAGRGDLVATRVPGESIGELALMYGSPRNATCVAKTELQGYVLTRDSFRHILVGSTQRKKEEVQTLRRLGSAEMNERDVNGSLTPSRTKPSPQEMSS